MAEIVFNNLKSFDGFVSETEFNALVNALQSVTINPGIGYTVSRNAMGTVLTTKPGAGGSSLIPCPFDVSIKAGTGTDDKIINVRAGTANQLLPSNILHDFHFDPTSDESLKVKVIALTDGTRVTSCILVVDTDDADIQTPVAFALPTSVEILTGVVIKGIYYRVIPCGSIQLVGQEQYKMDKNPPADPGQLQYTAYYTWVLQ